ncbi:MAG: VOC family protein [Telluria sp.]
MKYSYIGLDHVQLAAPRGCEEEARRFFGALLGWTEIDKPEPLRQRGGLWFQCGAQQVHIGVDESFAPAKKAHPAIAVQGIAALQRHLEQQGIAVREDRELAGVQRFFIADPFGNRIEFTEPSPRP